MAFVPEGQVDSSQVRSAWVSMQRAPSRRDGRSHYQSQRYLSSKPVVSADIVFLKEDPEFLDAGEVTMFFLDARHDLANMPVPVFVAGTAYEKIKIEVE
jgi:hypothetical protein